MPDDLSISARLWTDMASGRSALQTTGSGMALRVSGQGMKDFERRSGTASKILWAVSIRQTTIKFSEGDPSVSAH
jgi:hypothetical protein